MLPAVVFCVLGQLIVILPWVHHSVTPKGLPGQFRLPGGAHCQAGSARFEAWIQTCDDTDLGQLGTCFPGESLREGESNPEGIRRNGEPGPPCEPLALAVPKAGVCAFSPLPGLYDISTFFLIQG